MLNEIVQVVYKVSVIHYTTPAFVCLLSGCQPAIVVKGCRAQCYTTSGQTEKRWQSQCYWLDLCDGSARYIYHLFFTHLLK